MKTHIATAIAASLLVASMGSVAFAQQTTPAQSTTSAQSMNRNSQSMNRNAMSGQNNNSSSQQMKQQIKQALTSHGVTATGVNISVDNGTARLSGNVYTQQDISKAKKAAMGVNGIRQVDTSGLHVRQSRNQQGNQGNQSRQGKMGNQSRQGNMGNQSRQGNMGNQSRQGNMGNQGRQGTQNPSNASSSGY